ncbi:patatin-like phospholipase family protein [Maribellus maritimus]|uniref:patatin-like phospholipase family protein n=1 Tax=Maribellus maritimus TaxID=2870838 RepID=UPI001EEBC5DB|nr:patatin-like phospholipase family protein [Maribellus maritimus]MCG6190388.1 patatin-like phospholipase family protein [Maribellus maritimus]
MQKIPKNKGLKNTSLVPEKIGIFILLCLIAGSGVFAAAEQQTKPAAAEGRPKVAVVLSGGGAKGFAHIGVLKVLEKEGIPIDIIVGTSMGSLVGGIYSLGYNASQIENLVKSLNWEMTITDEVPRLFQSKYQQELKQRYFLSLPISDKKEIKLPRGLMKGQNVLNIFCGLAGEVPAHADFSQFPVSFACVAADLETGDEVVIDKGFLPTAMYSSMAIPIAFQPSERDGHLLVDGGIVNNFPTDVAKRMGADIIIGVDIRNDYYGQDELKSITSVLNQLISFFDKDKDAVNKSYCDVIIRPDITGYSVSSFSKRAADTLIFRGEQAALDVVSQLRKIKTEHNLQPRQPLRNFVKPEDWYITKVNYNGSYYLSNDFIANTFGLELPGNYSADDIKNGIDRIYGLGGFKKVYYYLENNDEGKTLIINIESEKVFTQNFGFKVNTTDAAAILINTTQRNYRNIFGLFSINGELSVNPGLDITIETNRTKFPTAGLNFNGKYQNINIYEDADKLFKTSLFYTSAGIYFYQPFFKRYYFGAGIREEYFNGDLFTKETSFQWEEDKINMFLTNAYVYVSYDNMDDFYFPTKGTSMKTRFSLLGDLEDKKEICPALYFEMKNIIPAWQETAWLFDIYARALLNTNYPDVKMTLIGGEAYTQYFDYHLPFIGLPAVNVGQEYVYIGMLGYRFHMSDSQYMTLLANGLLQDSDWLLGEDSEFIFGGGVRYSLKTMLGPLDATLGFSNVVDKPTFAASFGYWF